MLICHGQMHFPGEESQLPVSLGETHHTAQSSPRQNVGRMAKREQGFCVLLCPVCSAFAVKS